MNYYETLGVSKTATQDEIKAAYRLLASKHHPDKGGTVSAFQDIQAAYATLSDAGKRQAYDNPPMQHGGFGGGFAGARSMDDIIREAMRQHPGFTEYHQRQSKPIIRTSIDVSLHKAYTGDKFEFQAVTLKNGKEHTGTYSIDIPPGVRTGHNIRYDNVVDDATLVVSFRVLNDSVFEINGTDLRCEHKISVLDLIIGTKFEVNTVSGKTLMVAVPPKTNPLTTMRVPGEGMPVLNPNKTASTIYGDLMITLRPVMPDIISPEIIEVIKRVNQQKV